MEVMGWLLFSFGAVAIIVVAIVRAAAKSERWDKIPTNYWHLVGIILILLSIVFQSLVIIPAGERGVQLRFGDVEGVLNEGLQMKLPFVDTVTRMSVKTQLYEVPATAASKDLQDVTTTIALNYKLEPTKVGDIYKTIGKEYIAVIANPVVQETVKQVTARYNAEDMIHKREQVKEEIKTAIFNRLSARSIIAEEISITNFEFSNTFTQAIEDKVKAEQEIQTAKNQLERIKVEAEQRAAEAEGYKQAEILRAEGEARAIQIVTEAQTNANSEISESLSPEVLQYIFLDRLGEDIKVITVPNGMTLTLPN